MMILVIICQLMCATISGAYIRLLYILFCSLKMGCGSNIQVYELALLIDPLTMSF
jgi:hypothetical protein